MSLSAAEVSQSVTEQGFSVIPGVLEKSQCEVLIAQLGPVTGAGRRGILNLPTIAKLACSDRFLRSVQPHLSGPPRPVRSIYFDKTPKANWTITWHQDLTLAVRRKIDVPGFAPWSVKDGVPHVQPPVQLLQQMLTIRLHLDACDEINGALSVIPGSHRFGRLSANAIQSLRENETAKACPVAIGGAFLMRPLLLHSSGRSRTENHRRVIHIEYAGFSLPSGLEWHEAPGLPP